MPKIDEVTRREAVELYKSGMGAPEVGHALGLGATSIYRILEDADVHRDRRRLASRGMPKFDEPTSQEIADRYASGMSLSALAQEYGGTQVSIASAVRRAGARVRSRGNSLRHLSDEECARIVALRRDGWSQDKIARAVGISQPAIGRFLRKEGFATDRKAEAHGNWKGGRARTHGYVYVRIEDTHPFACMRNNMGYVAEHRLVVAEKVGRALSADETVHHRNGRKDDNRPENLELRFGNHGKGAELCCADCGSRRIVAMEVRD